MDLVESIYYDLISDLNKWHKKDNGILEDLQDLKELLSNYVDTLDSEIILQKQDKNNAKDDYEFEKCRED